MGSKNKDQKSKFKNKEKNKSNSDLNPQPPAADRRKNDGSGGSTITDSRFAFMLTDPRFRKAPKHKSKVAIDSRFNRMFTDKSFAASSAKQDKRGKPKKKTESSLHNYYHLEEEQKKRKDETEPDAEDGDSEEEEEEESENKKELLKKDKESEGESSEMSESGTELEEEEESGSTTEEEIDGVDMASEDEEADETEQSVPMIEKETRRLALVNMDWRHVKAVDLFVVLSSFLPKDGQILSVSVYPSEFGLQRMKEEEIHGPVGLFDDDEEEKDNSNDEEDKDNASDEEEDSGSDEEEEDNGSDGEENDNISDEEEEDNVNDGEENVDSSDEEEMDKSRVVGKNARDDDEIDNEKLREYERSKLRYYYAVVECDSSATADYLYKSCDGLEFERSSNLLDLRFIPDDMEFKHPPRDVATEAPPKYEGLNFQTQALQQSRINLTWDADEPERVKTLKRKFNDEQLAELELKEFLASDGSESDEEENDDASDDESGKRNKKKEKYLALLQSGDGSDEDDEDEGQDMEVTFNNGLEDLSKRILEKKDKKSETVWEAYLKKKREKKKARKHKSKNSSDEDADDSDQGPVEEPDDFFVEEPSFKKSKKESKKQDKQEKGKEKEDEASKAELELLLADDNGADTGLRGYNIKAKKTKGKRGKEIRDEDKIPAADYNDPRFSALVTKPDFALDPTDPQFKRSAAYARQMVQKQHKDKHGNRNFIEAEPVKPPTIQKPDNLQSKKEKHELSSMVRSLKFKSKQVQLPSNGKSKKDEESRSKGVGEEEENRDISNMVQSLKKKSKALRK